MYHETYLHPKFAKCIVLVSLYPLEVVKFSYGYGITLTIFNGYPFLDVCKT